MKHIKIYEQYDFEDLSDEELFGKVSFKLIKLKNDIYFILEKIENGYLFLYNGYEWKKEELYEEPSVNIEDLSDDDIITTHEEINGNGFWMRWNKYTLPEEIKDKLK